MCDDDGHRPHLCGATTTFYHTYTTQRNNIFEICALVVINYVIVLYVADEHNTHTHTHIKNVLNYLSSILKSISYFLYTQTNKIKYTQRALYIGKV